MCRYGQTRFNSGHGSCRHDVPRKRMGGLVSSCLICTSRGGRLVVRRISPQFLARSTTSGNIAAFSTATKTQAFCLPLPRTAKHNLSTHLPHPGLVRRNHDRRLVLCLDFLHRGLLGPKNRGRLAFSRLLLTTVLCGTHTRPMVVHPCRHLPATIPL